MKGPPPRNEDDVEEVLSVLARHLSSETQQWHSEVRDETETETGADGRLVGPNGGTLDVQVTRALADQSLMRELSEGTVSKRVDTGHVARELLAAAQRKSDPRRGSDEARSGLVLALDAGRLPHSLLPPVLDASSFLSTQVTALGFRAVFVVGKHHSRTYRLDLGTSLAQDA